MKKILILMLCCIMYVNNAHSKICFLADPNCNMGGGESKKNNTNNNKPKGCPAEYNLLENQLCELKKYTSCTDQNTGITKYKVAEGCAPDYIDANDCLTKTGMYVCGEAPCGNCHEEKCSDQYKDCSSNDYINAIGSGSECEEKYERYYDKEDNKIKYSECICDVTEYPYTEDNCAHTLSGAKCKGDYGTYWKNCIKICEYEDKDECESTNKNFACIEVDGCYEPNGCKADYELVNNECIKSNPCEAYPYTSCPASAIKCETCENNGTTYYKAIECDVSDGWYHSDGECKPRDCSDFEWDGCPTNALCDPVDAFDRGDYATYYHNDPCVTAGQIKYQLRSCGNSNFWWGYYMKAGVKGCVPQECENAHYTSRPKNAESELCHKGVGSAKVKDQYELNSCKSYYHYENGECVVNGKKACVNHKLTEIPANADYSTCSPDGGTTKYYQFTLCKSGYNFVDGACVEPSGVTETDYPFTTEAECKEGGYLCRSSGQYSSKRYKRTRCAYGFHYDNGVCIENDCSAYPFRYDRFDSDSPYMSGPSCEKPLPADGSMTDPDGRLTYIMLIRCTGGYKFDPNGSDCIKSIIPPEARKPSATCPENAICDSEHTDRVYKNSNTYKYWEECKKGFYFNGEKCIANKCPDFPFTSEPENAKDVGWCNKAGTKMYRARTCKQGYRLNNHGCELNTCNGYSLTEKPTNAYYDRCYSGDLIFYKVTSCYNNYQLIDGVCVKK